MKKIIKQYVTDILWAILVTIFEISVISLCLFLISYFIPHNITFLPINFLSWFVLVMTYRLLTYKFNNQQNSSIIEPGYSSVPYKNEEDTNIPPVRNIIPSEETDDLNRDYSVRE